MSNESDCLYRSPCSSRSTTTSPTTLDISTYVTPFTSPIKSTNFQLSSAATSSLSSASLCLTTDDEDGDNSTIRNQTDSYCMNELQHQLNSLRVNSADSSSTLVSSYNQNHHKRVLNNPFYSEDLGTISSANDTNQKYIQILDNLEQINLDFYKIENIEKQISALKLEFNQLRESVSRKTLISIHLMRDLIRHNNNPANIPQKQSKDAYIQCQMSVLTNCDNLSQINENISEQLDSHTDSKSELTNELKYQFRKLPALVKGFLVRRLHRTDTVQDLKRTINDTSIILLNFKSNLFRDGKLMVTHQDILFHQRLCIQLERSCKELYTIFFNTPIAKQMAIIAKHRVYLNNLKFIKKDRRMNSAMSHASSLTRSQSSVVSSSSKSRSKIHS